MPARCEVTLDAGTKALSTEDFGGNPYADVVGGPEWTASRGCSEEHLPVDFEAGAAERGTAVLLLPCHPRTTRPHANTRIHW